MSFRKQQSSGDGSESRPAGSPRNEPKVRGTAALVAEAGGPKLCKPPQKEPESGKTQPEKRPREETHAEPEKPAPPWRAVAVDTGNKALQRISTKKPRDDGRAEAPHTNTTSVGGGVRRRTAKTLRPTHMRPPMAVPAPAENEEPPWPDLRNMAGQDGYYRTA